MSVLPSLCPVLPLFCLGMREGWESRTIQLPLFASFHELSWSSSASQLGPLQALLTAAQSPIDVLLGTLTAIYSGDTLSIF